MMRRFGQILFAGVASALVAEGFNYAVTNWTSCQGEGLACTMDGIAGSIATLAFACLTMLVLGVVMLWWPRPMVLNIALLIVLIPLGLLLAMTLHEIVVLRDGWYFYWREVQKLLQVVASPALVVLVQWVILRAAVVRAQPAARS